MDHCTGDYSFRLNGSSGDELVETFSFSADRYLQIQCYRLSEFPDNRQINIYYKKYETGNSNFSITIRPSLKSFGAWIANIISFINISLRWCVWLWQPWKRRPRGAQTAKWLFRTLFLSLLSLWTFLLTNPLALNFFITWYTVLVG